MEVRHDEQQSRFVAQTGAGEARLAYVKRGGEMDLRHTEVPPEASGQGIGGRLVRAALEHARECGAEVVPSCPFVRSWLEDHPAEAEGVRR